MPSNLPQLLSRSFVLAVAIGGIGAALAQTPSDTDVANASGGDTIYDYGPFNPVPDSQLRPFNADRPGKTSSPQTVDAGHLQIEAGVFEYSVAKADGTTDQQWSTPNALLRYGLNDWSDLEVQLPSLENFHEDNRTAKTITEARGLSDTWVGASFNIFGNDPGDGPANQAFAIIPMVKIPTARSPLGNTKTEGSVALPYQINLPHDWSVTVENADGILVGHDNHHYVGDYQAMVNISHPLFFDNLSAQLEYAYDIETDPKIGHSATIDPALQWTIKPNLAVDVGDYVGLTAKAGDNPYVGISTRF